MAMDLQEHLRWAKDRAIAELDSSDDTMVAIGNALASIASDLNKHPDTKDHIGLELCMQLIFIGSIRTKQQMIDFIEGFR